MSNIEFAELFASLQQEAYRFSRQKGYEKMKNKKIIASVTALLMLPSNALADVNYTVQKGDSYWNISQKFNTTLKSVLSSNGATENSSLYIGQKIIVPSHTYTVQKGDTYYLIAKKCGVTLSSLLDINNANENSSLYIGQKITIPGNTSDKTHIVQKGETYWLIRY